MSEWESALTLLAGFAAGVVNVVAGAGTLITFPALLAMGVPPVTANVSSSLGLVPGSLSGVWGFRRELRPHWRTVIRLGIFSGVGAMIGGWLLVVLPSTYFGAVVPYLLLVAAVLAAAQPVISRRRRASGVTARTATAGRSALRRAVLPVAVLLTGVYGGYFGAAQGVILLAVLGIVWAGSLVEANGVKNALVAVANGVSAVVFIVVGAVDWKVAVLVGIGALLGGLVGARLSRWLPAAVLRGILVVVAVIAAVVLFITG